MIPEYHLKELIDGLESASQEKILGVFSLPICTVRLWMRIRDHIGIETETFKQSGKKIIGYIHSPSQLDYLVYSVCDELIMDPAGTMIITGLASEQLFLGDSLKKYGVGIQVVRTGRYKGAVETFTDNKFSDENRAQIQNLLNRRWKHYTQTISTSRSMRLEDLNQTLAENFIWKPKDALERGFVDRIDDFGGVINRLVELGAEEKEENTFAQIGLRDYLSV